MDELAFLLHDFKVKRELKIKYLTLMIFLIIIGTTINYYLKNNNNLLVNIILVIKAL